MKIRNMLSYFWKLPLCGIVFFIGMALGSALLTATGLQVPEIPDGTDANMIAMCFLLGSMLLALALSMISQRLALKDLGRWLILATLTWVVGAVGMVLESFFFMETGAVSSSESTLFTILNFILPSIFLSGMVTLLFRPDQSNLAFMLPVRFTTCQWGWRMLGALLAYPLVYIIFGLLVQPFVMDYYTQGLYELTVPTWGQLIPLQLLRSALFLLVCLPVIRWWKGSDRGLWLLLGVSFFVLTAFMAVITAYWFPWQMRLFHGLELLADAMIYIGILVYLFGAQKRVPKSEIKNDIRVNSKTIIILTLAFLLVGCADHGPPTDQSFTPPRFSVALETNSNQETHGSMIVTNTGEDIFPEDEAFEGEMNLWDQTATLRSKIEALSIGKIQPGESIYPASWRWHLDPGIYFLAWGSPKYGGVITVFSVIEEVNRLYLGESQSFRTKPTNYTVTAVRVGSIEAFTLENDGTLNFRGETTLPENGCIFPLLFDYEGIIDGFSIGACAQIADGRWQLQILPDLGGSKITIKPDTSYRVIIFSDDLTIPPSEPFEIFITQPEQK